MDIDIDVSPDVDVEALFPKAIPASTIEKGNIKKHLVGYYFQRAPVDSLTGVCAVNYKDTEEFGLYKIDFLVVNLLQHFESKEEMRRMQREEPNWDLLLDREVVEQLF